MKRILLLSMLALGLNTHAHVGTHSRSTELKAAVESCKASYKDRSDVKKCLSDKGFTKPKRYDKINDKNHSKGRDKTHSAELQKNKEDCKAFAKDSQVAFEKCLSGKRFKQPVKRPTK